MSQFTVFALGWRENSWVDTSQERFVKYFQLSPRFELGSPFPFPTTVTITPRSSLLYSLDYTYTIYPTQTVHVHFTLSEIYVYIFPSELWGNNFCSVRLIRLQFICKCLCLLFISRRLRRLHWQNVDGAEGIFLILPDACGLQPCVWPHFNKGLVPYMSGGGTEKK